MTEFTFHPLANIFPLLEGADFEAMVDDICEHGLREKIVLFDGQILDGRNRFRACEAAGVKPQFSDYGGDNPLAFVISANLTRRHLSADQRAVVAAKIANMDHGGDRKGDQAAKLQFDQVSRSTAAQLMNVSERSVNSAAAVFKSASAAPSLKAAMESSRVAPSFAEKLLKAPIDKQAAIVAKIDSGMKPTEAVRQVTAEEKRESEAVAPSGRYRVIYADPPWSYGNNMPDYHSEQRDYYPVMSLDEICAMPVREWVEDDAVLFLWATSPILEESFEVIKSWGFHYKASFVWDKVKHNMGHYNSVRHEFLLICTRGACQPDVRKLFDSVVSEERTEHSRKPVVFRTIIDTIYPHGARIELFCRGEAPSPWATFGNEASNAE